MFVKKLILIITSIIFAVSLIAQNNTKAIVGKWIGTNIDAREAKKELYKTADTLNDEQIRYAAGMFDLLISSLKGQMEKFEFNFQKNGTFQIKSPNFNDEIDETTGNYTIEGNTLKLQLAGKEAETVQYTIVELNKKELRLMADENKLILILGKQ